MVCSGSAEPDAIPTKLDVIIGNRYFQLIFEVEPYLPNIGLRSKWTTQNEGNKDHGNGATRDTEMKEAENNKNTNITDASVGNIKTCHKTRSEALEAQIDMDFSNEDLLGEENELSDAASDFLEFRKEIQ